MDEMIGVERKGKIGELLYKIQNEDQDADAANIASHGGMEGVAFLHGIQNFAGTSQDVIQNQAAAHSKQGNDPCEDKDLTVARGGFRGNFEGNGANV